MTNSITVIKHPYYVRDRVAIWCQMLGRYWLLDSSHRVLSDGMRGVG